MITFLARAIVFHQRTAKKIRIDFKDLDKVLTGHRHNRHEQISLTSE